MKVPAFGTFILGRVGQFGFCLALIGSANCIGTSPVDYEAQIKTLSKGWSIQQLVLGDLNGDGILDAAAILTEDRPNKKKQSKGHDLFGGATLRVYFSNQAGKLSLNTEAPKAVCLGCGGMKGGDMPYGIEIKNGVLLITYSGGSREMSESTTKWRFQKGDFFLIGFHEVQHDTIAGKGEIWSIERDANISTLQMEETIEIVESESPEGQVKTKTKKLKCRVSSLHQTKTLRDEFPERGLECSSANL